MFGRAIPSRSLLAIPFAAALALAIPGCSQGPEEVVQEDSANLSQAQRMQVMTTIRDAARSKGMRKAFLLAGLANHETNLTNCWKDATWACQGPNSPECGGPVIAGSADGPCGNQQGGLGLFQFDAGTYWQTLNTYSNDVLTVAGSAKHAVDFAVRIVRDSPYTTNAETDAKALAWLNNFDIGNGGLRDQWIKTVLLMYNGCQPGWDCWSDRYPKYNNALQEVVNQTGLDFWNGGNGNVDGCDSSRVGGAIAAKYDELGGCGSVLGGPLTNETPAPDGVGRYNVFEKGSIYWTPNTGAHEVHGQIRDQWKELGWETAEGKLGYPITDETKTPDGVGRYNVFERGSIYWTSETGAHEVLGVIRDKYKLLGWEAGPLGYPTSGEQDVDEGKRSDFQHGYILWDKTSGETTAIFKH